MKKREHKISAKMARFIKNAGFGDQPKIAIGKYAFVGRAEDIGEESLRSFATEFDPLCFFDPRCPHCKPFLEKGALIVFDGTSATAVRELGQGGYESVILTEPGIVRAPATDAAGGMN